MVRSILKSGDVLEKDLKECFLMAALLDVLCPTTCHRLGVKFLPAATLAMHANEYDWCSLLLDHLRDCIRRFSNRFYVDGFASGLGDCTFFLAVLYLDKLKRTPIGWGIWPRLKAWSKKDLTKAKDEDMLESGDFGKLRIVDVAYGEKHSNGARDLLHPHVHQLVDSSVYDNTVDAAHMRSGGFKRRTNVTNP